MVARWVCRMVGDLDERRVVLLVALMDVSTAAD